MIEAVKQKMQLLRLKAFAENIEQALTMAQQKNWSALQLIDHLAALELELRRLNRIQLCYKQSGLTDQPTIDQFDFNHHPSRKKQKMLIQNLMSLDFIARHQGNSKRQKSTIHFSHGHDQSSGGGCR